MKFTVGFASLIVGLIFGIGLAISGMTQPGKVIGFLDLFGNWDPSLIFVMGGSVVVHFITYRFIRNRNSPLLSPDWHVPTKTEITPALIIGSLLFGVGWGLGGFCPGPGITSLASLGHRPLIFVTSLFVGMFLFKLLDKTIGIRR